MYRNLMEDVMEYVSTEERFCDEKNEQNTELQSKSLITEVLSCKLPWIKFNTGMILKSYLYFACKSFLSRFQNL